MTVMDDLQMAAYVDAACAAQGIRLDPEERRRVIGRFGRMQALAAPLLDLPLPEEVEMAPIFRP